MRALSCRAGCSRLQNRSLQGPLAGLPRLPEMPHVRRSCKAENWARGGRGDGGRNLCAAGMTKPSIRLSGASRAPVPARSNWLVGEAAFLDASPWKVSHVFCCRRVPCSAAAFQPEGGWALPTHFLYAENVPPRKWG